MPAVTNTAATEVSQRVANLRQIAEADPGAATRAAWQWLVEARAAAGRHRGGTAAQLDQLFRLGHVPQGLDGTTEGILVMPLIHPLIDLVVRTASGVWMPWHGKAFDLGARRGLNHLAPSMKYASRLLWPRYSTTARSGGGRAGFRFETYVAPGKLDPTVRTLVIDYSKVSENPLVIRAIRDELVQIVPGAFLGKILFRLGRDTYTNIGFFALRDPH